MKIIVSSFSDKVFINDIDDNIDAINKFVDDGNMFIIATGKNISNVNNILTNKDIKCSYYICNDGATIFDQFMNVIYRVDIDKEYVRPIYNALTNSKYISDVKIDVSTGFVSDYYRSANKIVAKYNDYKAAFEIEKALNDKFHGLNTYVSTNFINITNSKVSKGSTLDYLLKYYNLVDNEIYTICKDDNDATLAIYNSYVIDNSSNKFKEHANSFIEALEKITSDDD